jgi:preprotein translocase subunit SecA
VVNLKNSVESEGKEIARAYEKTVVLSTIDEAWKEHLREMDELKQSVQNASYEQKDPLLIYKFESYELFKTMLNRINKDVISTLMKGFIPRESTDQVKEAERRRRTDMSNLRTSRPDLAGGGDDPSKPVSSEVEPVRVEKKVGRNDPCPCGSGKKFKQCHGAGLADSQGAPGAV